MDKRRIPRLRTFKGGSIIIDGAATIDCIIRNMSDKGAELEIESPVGIPDNSAILIKPESLKRDCLVIWRSAKRIGVEFV